MDYSTTEKKEMMEARVCIEVNTVDDLLDKVPAIVKGQIEMVLVKYDWKPLACEGCRTFELEIGVCPLKKQMNAEDQQGACQNVKETSSQIGVCTYKEIMQHALIEPAIAKVQQVLHTSFQHSQVPISSKTNYRSRNL